MKGISSILFVADGAPEERYGLAQALAFARAWGARLVVMDVIEIPALEATVLKSVYPGMNILARLQQARSEELEAMLVALPTEGLDVRISVTTGRLHTEVVKRISRGGHKLLIKAAKGPAHAPRSVGPMDLRLIRLAPCSVMILRAKPEASGVVLAALSLDGGHGSSDPLEQRMLGFGKLMASTSGAQLHLAHAWEIPDAKVLRAVSSADENTLLRELIQSTHAKLLAEILASSGDISATPHLLEGWASHAIPQLVGELHVDLLLLGSRGSHSQNCPSLGSILHVILHQVDCSVLVCKV